MAGILPVIEQKADWLRLLLLGALLVALTSCQDSAQRENEKLRQEITEVHDRAMEEIEPLYELRTKLARLRTGHAEKCMDIEIRITDLLQADEAMFSWMRQYQPLAVVGDVESDTRYRVDQLAQITEVGQVIDQAISQAESCLATAQPHSE